MAFDEFAITEVEREICRLPAVSLARVVADSDGQVIQAHLVVLPGTNPQQIVRDVQSVARSSFGLDLDRRIFSVVQSGASAVDRATVARTDRRPSIGPITVETNGLRSLVRVTLTRDEEEVIGSAEDATLATERHRLVAAATVDALRQLEPEAESIEVDDTQIVRVGAHDIAVVTIVFVVAPAEQIVAGSAMVRSTQDSEAFARAVLDATNRRLT